MDGDFERHGAGPAIALLGNDVAFAGTQRSGSSIGIVEIASPGAGRWDTEKHTGMPRSRMSVPTTRNTIQLVRVTCC